MRSYALDAIDRVGENESAPEAEGARFLDDVRAAREEAFPAVGLGQDLRLSGAAVTGGALLHEAKVVHLCAFRLPGKGEATDGDSGTSMARSSLRRRSWL